MSVETVLNNVTLRLGIDDTTLQISGTDYQTRLLRMFMNETGKDIARRTEWPRMLVDHSVAGDVTEETLPSDFFSLASRGSVRLNKSTYQPVRNVTTEQEWQFVVNSTTAQPFFHLTEGKIEFNAQLDTDGAILRYVSTYWVDGKDTVTQNSDEFKIPERLIEKGMEWRWNRFHGLPFDDIMAEYEADLLEEINASRGS